MHFPFGPVGGPYSPFSSWRIRCWGMSKSSHPVFEFLVLLVKMWSGDLLLKQFIAIALTSREADLCSGPLGLRATLGAEYIPWHLPCLKLPLGLEEHHLLCPNSVLRQLCSVLQVNTAHLISAGSIFSSCFPWFCPSHLWKNDTDSPKLNYCYHSNKDMLLIQP